MKIRTARVYTAIALPIVAMLLFLYYFSRIGFDGYMQIVARDLRFVTIQFAMALGYLFWVKSYTFPAIHLIKNRKILLKIKKSDLKYSKSNFTKEIRVEIDLRDRVISAPVRFFS